VEEAKRHRLNRRSTSFSWNSRNCGAAIPQSHVIGWKRAGRSMGGGISSCRGSQTAMKILALSLAALAACSANALAADLPLGSRIRAVTVHPQGAAVLREAAFSVPSGVSVLVVEDLPADMVADSLRVEGLAAGGVTIRSVETRPGKTDPEADPARTAIASAIQALARSGRRARRPASGAGFAGKVHRPTG
jgi:hypothetical protein